MERTGMKRIVSLYPLIGKRYGKSTQRRMPTFEPDYVVDKTVYLGEDGEEYIKFKNDYYKLQHKELTYEWFAMIEDSNQMLVSEYKHSF